MPKRSPSAKTVRLFGLDIARAPRRCLLPDAPERTFYAVNPHSAVLARNNHRFRDSLSAADVLFPDGAGIAWAARRIAGVRLKRITGFDMFVAAMEQTALRRGRVFFLGGSVRSARRIAARAHREYPGLSVSSYTPPFADVFSPAEEDAIVDAINRAAPDVLFVGLGAPKQELVIEQIKKRITVPKILAIGAVFDFYAGTVRRPGPLWQRLQLEWLGRLVREPRRLWRRTVVSGPRFAALVVRQRRSSDRTFTFVQQYYHPDASAVARLLHQLLMRLSESTPDTSVQVLTGRRVRADISVRHASYGRIRTVHAPLRLPGSGAGIAGVAEMIWFHLWVFVSIVCGPRRTIIALTTPPLIGFTTAMACRVKKIPFYHYVEDLYPELLFDAGLIRAPWIVKKLAVLNRMTFRTARRVIVIAESMKRKVMNNYGLSAKKIDVVPNWSSIDPGEHHTVTQPRLDFLYSGNFGFGHAFGLMEQFFITLAGDPVSVRLVGGGRRFQSVRQRLSLQGLTVESSGYVTDEEHRRQLQEAAFLIVAQDYRTVGDLVPSKFYTYCASGRPIVFFGTRVSEIGRTIVKHKIGVVIEVERDICEAVAWVREIVATPNAFHHTGDRARNWYRANGGVERAAQQFRTILGVR